MKPLDWCRLIRIATIAGVAWTAGIFAQHTVAQTALLHGCVQTAQAEPVQDSLVVPVEDASGRPLLAGQAQPIENLDQLFQATQTVPRDPDSPRLLFAYTDKDGRFTFQLPPGKYRLIALRTPGSEVPPTPLAVARDAVQLDGVSDPIDLRAAAMADVTLRPLGNCELAIETKVSNDDCFLFVSRAPLAADPVLGFAGWDSSFLESLMLVVRMDQGRCRIRGLPEGALHFAAFANDNNPGFGGATIRLKRGIPARERILIVASWSDGHKEPPPELKSLVERVQQDAATRQAIERQLQTIVDEKPKDRPDPLGVFQVMQRHLDDSIELPDGSRIAFRDAAAAFGYAQLRANK